MPGFSPYLPAPHADAYEQYVSGGPLTGTTVFDYTWADASSEIVSTPDDLDRFFLALVTGRLLPPAQLAEMETTVPTRGEDGLMDRYGLGLAWQPLSCGGGYWTHGGDVIGSATYDGVTVDGRRSPVVEVFTELTGEAGLREHQLEEQLVDNPPGEWRSRRAGRVAAVLAVERSSDFNDDVARKSRSRSRIRSNMTCY